MTEQDEISKIAALAKDMKMSMLTTIDSDGNLVARPMAVQEVAFDGDLWFFTESDSRKIEQIKSEPRVGVSFSSNDTWLSISGEAEVIHDVEKAKELWSARVKSWLPQGPEDPSVALIKVHATHAEYIDTPGSKISTAISFAKSRLTGERFEGSETGKVDL